MHSSDNELNQITSGLRAHLETWQAFGIHTLKTEETNFPSPSGSQNSESAPDINELESSVSRCQKCSELAKTRTQTVFGTGRTDADLVFVGEAPGFDEDKQGKPFVGRAGQLLTRMILAMGFKREDVYICNVLKCRPSQNRNPLPEEVKNCHSYLISQLDIIKPRVIVALGKFAAQTLLASDTPISRLRGNFYEYRNIPLMPTFHPAYLLRNERDKKLAWEDLKQVMSLLKNFKT